MASPTTPVAEFSYLSSGFLRALETSASALEASASSAGLFMQQAVGSALDLGHAPDTYETVNIQGVDHPRIDLSPVRRGHVVLVHIPRWKKTFNQLVISTAERAHFRLPKRLLWDKNPRGSVNVVHAAIVLAVDQERQILTVAEASGKDAVCQRQWNFGDPDAPDAHVYAEAKYLFYGMYDGPEDDTPGNAPRSLDEPVGDLADKWSAGGGGYASVPAALAAVRSNHAGFFDTNKLLELAKLADQNGPLVDRHGKPEAMFCSQLVGRVVGTTLVRDALAKNNLMGSTNKAARRVAREAFDLAPDALLPSSLHYYLDTGERSKCVGVLETAPRGTSKATFKNELRYRTKAFAMRHGVQGAGTSPTRLLPPGGSNPGTPPGLLARSHDIE